MNEDFEVAFEETQELIDDLFEEAGDSINAGPVLIGMLAAIIHRLILGSPDQATVVGAISSAMGTAAIRAELGEEIFKQGPSSKIH